ncbi:hypothetical protein HRbin40_00849 [bacterium HR40]|nr:hypothetical protein HRbin40_00849 [bacterium HR40]
MRLIRAELELHTHEAFEVQDVTAAVLRQVERAGLRDGLVHIASRHTTAAVVINEYEPNLLEDLGRWLRDIVPAGGWKHDALARSLPGEPENTRAHLAAMLLGPSQTVAVSGGALALGTWQRLLFVELDGPRRRSLALTLWGEFARGAEKEG